MRISSLLMVFGAAALIVLGACGKRQVAKPVTMVPSECHVVSTRPDPNRPVTFALLDPVDLAWAPWAENGSERILFRHLYETLITIDCEGSVLPGLAEGWKKEEEGSSWTFELRKGARFWDGTRVTARDVVESWQDALMLDTVVDSVSAAGDRTVRVWMKMPHREVPRVFSASVFAVAKPTGDSRRPMGSGSYRLGEVDVDAYSSVWPTITLHPALGGSGPVIRFVEAPPDRARDLLEGSIDVMVSADPSVIEYASGRSEFLTVALPWEKTYVLLSTSRVRSIAEGRPAGRIPSDALEGLARDAVRGDARGCRPPAWWQDLRRCAGAQGGGWWDQADRFEISLSSPEEHRILYDAGDPAARGLAERIAALAAVDTTRSSEAKGFARSIPGFSSAAGGTTAQGVTRGDFEQSLRRGEEFAYVVSLPREAPDPCHERREFVERVPWIERAGSRLADALVPLVDTHSHVIVRKDAANVVIDGYGGVFVVPAYLERRGSR